MENVNSAILALTLIIGITASIMLAVLFLTGLNCQVYPFDHPMFCGG